MLPTTLPTCVRCLASLRYPGNPSLTGGDHDVPLDERPDARAGTVLQRLQQHPARVPFFVEFDGTDDLEDADVGDAMVRDRVLLRPEGHLGLVHSTTPSSKERWGSTIARRNLCSKPGGLVGSDAELRLGLLGRDAVGVASHAVNRLEPGAQRSLLRCITVPAETEVWRWHPAHSQVNGLVSSSSPCKCCRQGENVTCQTFRTTRNGSIAKENFTKCYLPVMFLKPLLAAPIPDRRRPSHLPAQLGPR
jgi:hypothetical protein